jgi:hypothetical protein
LGKAKGKRQNGSDDGGPKKRRNHRCWTKEAFPIDESPMGGKTESRSKDEVNLYIRGDVQNLKHTTGLLSGPR